MLISKIIFEAAEQKNTHKFNKRCVSLVENSICKVP
jgi:hypothetical protein